MNDESGSVAPTPERKFLSDIGTVFSKAVSLTRSGAVFRGGAARRRMLGKVKWLALKHLGVREVVLPFVNDMKLCGLTTDDVIASGVFLDGHFDYPDFQKALRLLDAVHPWNGSKAAFIDIGSNIGTHSLYALGSKKFQRVVSIEPEARNYAQLVRNLRVNGFDARNARNVGLSATAGNGVIALSNHNHGDNRLVREGESGGNGNGDFTSLERIVLVDFKSLLPSLDLPQDPELFFWIDTQGHELEVCTGIGKELLSDSVTVVEFWPALHKKNGTLGGLLSLLKETMREYSVLQRDEGGFHSITDLDSLANQMLQEKSAADQVDLFCIGLNRARNG